MKALELNDLETIQGGGWITGFACALTIAASIGVIGGTGGAAALPAAYVAGAVCGGSIGYGSASGDWI